MAGRVDIIWQRASSTVLPSHPHHHHLQYGWGWAGRRLIIGFSQGKSVHLYRKAKFNFEKFENVVRSLFDMFEYMLSNRILE